MIKMLYLSLLSLFYVSFFGSSYTAPFTIPYRYPTYNELEQNKTITISSQPITEGEIFIERGVLEYLVNNDFFKEKHLRQWNRLNQLNTLTPLQAVKMTRLKRLETRALRRFQRASGLPETGIIDTPVIRIVFPVICGTPDYVDDPFNDGFPEEDEDDVGALKKK
jgi:hypothetical protein